MEKNKKIAYLEILIIIFSLSLLYIFLYSFSTSPLYPYYYGGDSAQFQTVGKAWSLGKIPYRDMFDHKGPIVFFINMLGYSITKSSTGIALLQVIFMTCTMFFVFKIGSVCTNNKYYSLAVVIISFVVLCNSYAEGNFTEEYCLPFISGSIYFQIKYLKQIDELKDHIEHKCTYALFYGISIGVCFLTRATNAVGICAGIIIICFHLLYKRKFFNIFQNALFALLGFSIIIIPFCVYFILNNSFYDFIYGTIGFNIEYSAHMESWVKSINGDSVYIYIRTFFSSYSILLTAILALIRRNKIYSMYCFAIGLTETILFLNGALYNQYSIIALPQVALLLNEILLIDCVDRSKSFIRMMLSTMVLMFVFSDIGSIIKRPVDMHNTYKSLNNKGYEELLNIIPQNERDSFVAYGNNDLKEIYLLYDIIPYYKYFVIQDWHSSFSNKTKNDIHDTFLYGDVKWILANGNLNNIEDILNERYLLIDDMNNYRLYRLK